MMDGEETPRKRIVEVMDAAARSPRWAPMSKLEATLSRLEAPMAFRAMFKVGEIQEKGGTLQVEALPVPKPEKKKDRDAPAVVQVEGVLTFGAKHPELMRVLQANKGGIVYLDLTPAED